MTVLLEVFLTLAFGAVHSLPMGEPGLWWLQPLALAWLVWRVGQSPPRHAAWLGWLFGTAWLSCTVWWLFISMYRYGGLPAWMSAGAVLLLSGALSLYLALAMGLFARWRTRSLGLDTLMFSALWLLAELARGRIFTGFPWGASGYAHVEGPIAALAPWIGVYGLGALSTAVVAWWVLGGMATPVGRTLRWGVGGLMFAGLGLVHLAGPPEFTTSAGTVKVALLQNNVPQQEKFSPVHVLPELDWTRDKLTSLPVDLVIAPETVIPLLPEQMPTEFWAPVRAHFTRAGKHALLGLPLGDLHTGYTNSVAGLSAPALETPIGFYRYDKHHLVPFGEFIPTGFRWFTNMMNMPLGDFDRGVVNAPSFPVRTAKGTQWVAPNICYEDLFGEELAVRFLQPHPPTVMANLSNIGWFGNTVAVDQHLQISRMRSLELQRPMLRATNTGATAVIDHRGVVVDRLPAAVRGVLGGQVEGREGFTPFAYWASRGGVWPLVVVALLVVAAVRRHTRRRHARPL